MIAGMARLTDDKLRFVRVREGYRREIRLHRLTSAEPVFGRPRVSSGGGVLARARVPMLILLLYFASGAIFVAAGMVMLYDNMFLRMRTPEPNVHNRSPVHRMDWEGAAVDSIVILTGLGFAGLGLLNACTWIGLEMDGESRRLKITRYRLFGRRSSTVLVQSAKLAVAPHEEPVKNGTMRCYVVLLEWDGSRPLVLFASRHRRPRDAQAAVEVAERWMDALNIRCKVYWDGGLYEAIDAG
jgi:hypothetical protein